MLPDITHDYQDLGNGFAVPRIRLPLLGRNDDQKRALAEEVFPFVDQHGALLIEETGLQSTDNFADFLASINSATVGKMSMVIAGVLQTLPAGTVPGHHISVLSRQPPSNIVPLPSRNGAALPAWSP